MSDNTVITRPFVRLDFLDTLRGMAALYVVFYHMVLLARPDLVVPSWLQLLIINGGTGVTLFFLISAFALCYSSDRRKKTDPAVRNFYLRRFFRIAPLFYFMLVFYYFRDIGMYGVHHGIDEILIAVSFLFNFSPDYMDGYVWAAWTIGVEMIFYLIFPFIYRHASNITSAGIFFLAAILLSWAWNFLIDHYAELYGYIDAGQRSKIANYSFFNHLPIFMFGIVIYHFFYFLNDKLEGSKRQQTAILLMLLFVFLYFSLLTGKIGGLWSVLVWQAIAYGMLILGLGLFPLAALVNKLSCGFGKMSYSLYLLHPTLVYLLSPVYHAIYSVAPLNSIAFLSCCLLTVLLLTSLSYFGYHFIERPGVRLGEWLIKRKRPA